MSLFLRTTDKYGRSFGGFQWPPEVGATVAAPDWEPTAKCGNGLHGLLEGLGDSSHLSTHPDAIWWIVSAENAIDLDGKYKFQSCTVVQFGDRATITAALYKLRPGPVHFLTLTGGDDATLTGGDDATLTGGNYATLTGGDGAKLIGGGYATLTGGYRATLTGGDDATLTGGDYATLTGGYRATLTGGYRATLTGGDCATLIFLRWIKGYRRSLTAYVGENCIKPGVAYRANDDHTAVVEVSR
jgi:hypothetical protein